ncbi:hypothetical protein [Paenibacillus oleatilyticus]|uniref:Uncharacterized protein n=1 Tax=Paenibacillus oleatilyticus TaxID=2594886 RepID=A0ABV4VC18_9BACL|nr:hypothetical protein [Paenibacillus oleatilyticus]MBU7320771.1 hypothetical protein [Paenibacillus oleatilyticus]
MNGLAVKDRNETSIPLTFGEKTELLKRYEVYCYQVAFYLLQQEAGARLAAEEALLALYKLDGFFALPEHERKEKVKAAAIRHALAVRSGRQSS